MIYMKSANIWLLSNLFANDANLYKHVLCDNDQRSL